MLRIEFKKEEIDKIRSLNKTHLHPFVRQKSNVLLLKANNISHGLIAQICDISENTLRNYFRGYMESGIESLTEIPFYKQQSKLIQFDSIIRKYFEETPPSTIKQACSDLEERIGFKSSETQMREYIKRQFKNLSKFSCKKLIKTKTYIKIKAIKKIHSIFHKFMRFYLNFFHAELFF